MREAKGYRPTNWIDPRVEIRQSPIHGKGMFASAPIKQDEIVNIWGGTLLLTDDDLRDQEKKWRAQRYVWAAIGEGLYLALLLNEGEKDLANFINHSCNPNVWMRDEVTLVARRDIVTGEELTIDYAMIAEDEKWVAPWECHCGSELCRGGHTGSDWRKKELQERYQDHFSPFICERIRRLQTS